MSAVPCNGCITCCKNEMLVLHPEEGDKAADYLTREVKHPFTGQPAVALQVKENGDCIYLGEKGCTIHGRAPAICREFDCRKFFLRAGDRAQRRQYVKQGVITKELLEAGRKRLHTLDHTD